MTDPIAEGGASAGLYTTFLSSIEEALEHAKAADTLGLGFRIESYQVTSAAGGEEGRPEFEFTLLADLPSHVDNEE